MGPTPHQETCRWWGWCGSCRFGPVVPARSCRWCESCGGGWCGSCGARPPTRTRAVDRTSCGSGRRPRSCELLELAADRVERGLDLAAERRDDGDDHRSDEGDEHAVLDGGRTALAGDVHAGLEVVEQLLDVHGGGSPL